MLNFLRSIFSSAPEPDYAALKRDGAVIIDVRTSREYASGHIKGSINIPLDRISTPHKQLGNKATTIITCCASGARSSAAARTLKNQGYQTVYNGGGWTSLQRKLAA